MNEVLIDTEYITLGQFLKMVDVIQSGGHAKIFLIEHQVKVNGEKETRRGRKLHPDDIISIEQIGKFQIKYSS